MKIGPYLFGLIIIALLVSIPQLLAAGAEDGAVRPPTREEREQVRLHHAGAAGATPSPAAAGRPVDVERYSIDISVIPSLQRVEGTVRIQARAKAPGLTELSVDLYDQMTVASATGPGGSALPFSHASDVVTITLDRAYDAGELIDLTIAYGGTPPAAGYGSFTFRTHSGQPVISSLSEPEYARTWWPCLDDPSDKAIVDMDLTVPSTLVGVSNGLLESTITNPDGTTTYVWRSSYPISTYLVSVAISNYETWTEQYTPVTGGPPMLVQHWVYPEHRQAAEQDFSVTVPQLEFFSNLFGEYPFVDEKYGHAIFPFAGGMEHQTATSYGAFLIRGDNAYDWVVAHELAHQWWGDSVSPADWRETWLNEGFATYSEALWWEHLYGPAGLRAYMSSLDSRPFCGPLYDTPCDIFGHTIYDKGAWVLHMLRGVLGDAAFFQGMRDHASTFKLANATTGGLRSVMEAASGRSLSSFFSRWVMQEGEPAYEWGWTAADTPAGWITHVHVEQVQPGAVFEMPIGVRVTTAGGEVDFTLDSDSPSQDFALPALAQEPTLVRLDPDDWILETSQVVPLPDADLDGVPDYVDNCSGSANPAQADFDNDGIGDACDPDIDGDALLNPQDCAPMDAAIQFPPVEVTGLDVAGWPITELSWDPAPAGTGPAFDLLRGSLDDIAIDGGVAAAACLQVGLPGSPGADGTDPAPGSGFYYLARMINSCGRGPLGYDSSGLSRASAACP